MQSENVSAHSDNDACSQCESEREDTSESDREDEDEAWSENAVHDEFCEANVLNAIEYNSTMQHFVLTGLTNDLGQVTNTIRFLVQKRFQNRTLHRFATVYRTAMCVLIKLQYSHRISKGMGHKQAVAARLESLSQLNLRAFLIHTSSDHLSRNTKAFERLVGQLDWHLQTSLELCGIRRRQDFMQEQAKITPEYLDQNFLMPRPMKVGSEGRETFKTVSTIISIFASVRIYRDNVTPDVAFDQVIQCKGYDARNFFG
jgi:hypothetical protein